MIKGAVRGPSVFLRSLGKYFFGVAESNLLGSREIVIVRAVLPVRGIFKYSSMILGT